MTYVPAPVASPRPLAPWMRVLAVLAVVPILPAALGAAALGVQAMSSDDPLAVIGLVLAALLLVWAVVPALLAGSALVVARDRAEAASGLVWAAVAWHGVCFLLLGLGGLVLST